MLKDITSQDLGIYFFFTKWVSGLKNVSKDPELQKQFWGKNKQTKKHTKKPLKSSPGNVAFLEAIAAPGGCAPLQALWLFGGKRPELSQEPSGSLASCQSKHRPRGSEDGRKQLMILYPHPLSMNDLIHTHGHLLSIPPSIILLNGRQIWQLLSPLPVSPFLLA